MTTPQAERPLILPPLRRTMFDAQKFAHTVHKGQTDKAGRAYTAHLGRIHERLVDMLDGLPEDQWSDLLQIAYLHDVIEDTQYTAADLIAEGFSNDVVMGVDALSKPRDMLPYLDWINHIATTAPLAVILVKIADVEDNSDPERLALLDEPTRERLKAKYGAALPILKHAAARMGWRQGNG